ncbi:MAG TPA: hypothetical protein VK494_01895 [Gemmatimonadaceae bacterium]|nr:hypothetical protein [Gemmatimonadaceae bacterium]
MRQSNSEHTPSRVTLNFVQHRLIRTALKAKSDYGLVTPEQRRMIRELCAQAGPGHEPEQALIAFKVALFEAASDAGIPFGPERNELLGRLVSVFIEEFYRGERAIDIRLAREAAAEQLQRGP